MTEALARRQCLGLHQHRIRLRQVVLDHGQALRGMRHAHDVIFLAAAANRALRLQGFLARVGPLPMLPAQRCAHVIAEPGVPQFTMIERLFRQHRILASGRLPVFERPGREFDIVQIDRHADPLGLRQIIDQLHPAPYQVQGFVVGIKAQAQAARRNHGTRGETVVTALRGMMGEICGSAQVQRGALLEPVRDAPVHDLATQRGKGGINSPRK